MIVLDLTILAADIDSHDFVTQIGSLYTANTIIIIVHAVGKLYGLCVI